MKIKNLGCYGLVAVFLALLLASSAAGISEFKINASDTASADNFGSSIVVNSDTVVIGSSADEEGQP